MRFYTLHCHGVPFFPDYIRMRAEGGGEGKEKNGLVHSAVCIIIIMVPAASGGRSLRWSQGGVAVGALQLNGKIAKIIVLELQCNPTAHTMANSQQISAILPKNRVRDDFRRPEIPNFPGGGGGGGMPLSTCAKRAL